MAPRVRVVGRVLNFDGLTYAPVNENGVILLFGKVHHDLRIDMESVRPGFPDATCIDYREDPDRGVEKSIEFEFRSSSFARDHWRKGQVADILVCWEHDWKDCPDTIEVTELKDVIKRKLSEEPERIDSPPSATRKWDQKTPSGWEQHKRVLTSAAAVQRRIEEAKRRGVSPKYVKFLEMLKRYWEKREIS